jgi:hypothetical protein
VRWRAGHTSADDRGATDSERAGPLPGQCILARAEELLHCPEKMAQYEASSAARPLALLYPPLPLTFHPQAPGPPGRETRPPRRPGLPAGVGDRSAGRAVGAPVLYLWPTDGWVRGKAGPPSELPAGRSSESHVTARCQCHRRPSFKVTRFKLPRRGCRRSARWRSTRFSPTFKPRSGRSFKLTPAGARRASDLVPTGLPRRPPSAGQPGSAGGPGPEEAGRRREPA